MKNIPKNFAHVDISHGLGGISSAVHRQLQSGIMEDAVNVPVGLGLLVNLGIV